MDKLIDALLICLQLTRVEASNGLVLRYHMVHNCKVVNFNKGVRKPWINATLDCECKGIVK